MAKIKKTKYQLEIEKILSKSESSASKELKSLYADLISEVTVDIVQLQKEIEADDKFSKKLQKERLEAIRSQMAAKIEQLNKDQKQSVWSFLRFQGDTAFNSLFYEFEMSEKIPLTFAMLTDKQLNVIINTPVASRKLSTRLQGNSVKMKKNLNRVLSLGFAKGLSTQKMARQIAEIGGATYKRSMNIARTEAGRVTGITTQQSHEKAAEAGVDLEKQWVSTLDGSTRHNHQKLDGQVREIDDYFEVDGKKALQPHMFGRPEEDINCRCRSISKIKGYDHKLRRDNESKEVIDYKNYEEWREAQSTRESGAISGALDDRNDKQREKLIKFGEVYYAEVRNRDKQIEVDLIAKNAGISSEVAERIYNHVFINEYELTTGYHSFDPDYDMARSWQRLREGKNIQKHDIIMLEHEMFESILMGDGMGYFEAHQLTNTIYNYQKLLDEFKYGEGVN